MNYSPTSERMSEAMQRARQHWRRELLEEARKMEPLSKVVQPTVIALSRQAGTGASELAAQLGQRLKWSVYDHELVEHIAQDENLRTELVESVDEKPVTTFSEVAEVFFDGGKVTGGKYLADLIHTLCSISDHGHCVVVGHASAEFLPVDTTLSVRLVAPLGHRVAAVQAQREISEKEAERYVDTTDADRHDFVKKQFRRETADPTNYDLVLNVARFSPEHCVDLIVEALSRKRRIVSEG